MNAPRLPAPEGESEPNESDTNAPPPDDSTRDYRPAYPTEEQCLAALQSLAQLVAMGVLNCQRANSMRGVYAEILRHYKQQRSPVGQEMPVTETLLDLLESHPDLVDTLAPLLPPGVIDQYLHRKPR